MSNALIPKVSEANIALPEFMRGETLETNSELRKYVVPPRIKVVQKQASQELLSKYDMGDVIIQPQDELLAPVVKNENDKPGEFGSSFLFVPVYFYPEFVLWNPIELKSTQPAIVDRTTDPHSEIAQRARNKALWYEDIEGQFDENGKQLQRRYVEHLNFLVRIIDNREVYKLPVLISFSRGEHWTGNKLCSAVSLRNAPMFGCLFEAHSQFRPPNKVGEGWYGLDCDTPKEEIGGFLQNPDDYSQCRALYKQLAELYEEGLIKPEYETETQATNSEVTTLAERVKDELGSSF